MWPKQNAEVTGCATHTVHACRPRRSSTQSPITPQARTWRYMQTRCECGTGSCCTAFIFVSVSKVRVGREPAQFAVFADLLPSASCTACLCQGCSGCSLQPHPDAVGVSRPHPPPQAMGIHRARPPLPSSQAPHPTHNRAGPATQHHPGATTPRARPHRTAGRWCCSGCRLRPPPRWLSLGPGTPASHAQPPMRPRAQQQRRLR